MTTTTHLTLPLAFDDAVHFDSEKAIQLGRAHTNSYVSATPFPHIVIDDFLPARLIDTLHADFPNQPTSAEKHYERGYKGHFKRQINPNECAASIREIFAAFNSAPMLQFLEELTGIKGLIPDSHFVGGGLHETSTGGFLGVHSDFRINRRLHVERRINAIIYLNKGWQPEYGGDLELWDKGMTTCLKKVSPIYNRCVIFNTDEDSNHGHPEPLTTPEGITRRSVALYYYTANAEIYAAIPEAKTDFKPRPKDRFSLKYYLDKLTRKTRN